MSALTTMPVLTEEEAEFLRQWRWDEYYAPCEVELEIPQLAWNDRSLLQKDIQMVLSLCDKGAGVLWARNLRQTRFVATLSAGGLILHHRLRLRVN